MADKKWRVWITYKDSPGKLVYEISKFDAVDDVYTTLYCTGGKVVYIASDLIRVIEAEPI